MVKLRVALESLSKTQLKLLCEMCPNITFKPSKTKKETIDRLEKALIATNRLRKLTSEMEARDLAIIKMFLQKKYRYNGMAQSEFTKFIVYNHRMKNSFTKNVSKLQSLGLIFMSVTVKKAERVIFPSEYLLFFNNYFKNGAR
ncbi:MAG: hypothetical protein ACTSUE_11595 [Promethearchaeota archaeon]